MNDSQTPETSNLLPRADWMTQRELAAMLGVSPKTASHWARAGKLKPFEHGIPCCGWRKYSRTLLTQLVITQMQRAEREAVA